MKIRELNTKSEDTEILERHKWILIGHSFQLHLLAIYYYAWLHNYYTNCISLSLVGHY
jgi:hypothetical protein